MNPRLANGMLAIALFTAVAPAAGAQDVPWGVGEKLVYDVKFGPIKVGSGRMEVASVEKVRGHDVFHTKFIVKGGTFFYRVDDLLESWFTVNSLSSLQFRQDFEEGNRIRQKTYMMYPERQTYTESGREGEHPSVEQPLDDGSFLYFVRTVPLEVGKTYEFNRYFKPDRNPVRIRVLRREEIKVPAGTFKTVVVQPIIKARGIFSDKGEAQVWLADDSTRIMVQMKSKLSFGSLNLYLKSYTPPTPAAAAGDPD